MCCVDRLKSQLKPVAKLGVGWRKTTTENTLSGARVEERGREFSYMLGLEFDATPITLTVGYTWRFEDLLSHKSSSEFAIEIGHKR